ncbi:MAG TPA: glycosyltransferase family 9 protein [Nitrospiraceae bacterium]|nr:glycosyltransferase family 9 protein [Nitrospiraceae bacterium]
MRRMAIVIHPGALGDVLLSLAAIRTIRNATSVCDIGLIAQGEAGRLLAACGEVQRLFSIESQDLSTLLSGGTLRPELQIWLQASDLTVAWMADTDGKNREMLHHVGVHQAIVRSPMSVDLLATHQEDRFLETVKSIAPGMPNEAKLLLPPSILASGKDLFGQMGIMGNHPRVAVFHPGSGSRHKCGDPVLFAKAIAYCQSNKTIPIIVGGPADDEAVAQLLHECEKRPLVIQHKELLSIAGMLAHASLFVGYDSGLTHLAARLHVPTLAIFGPTDQRRWAPKGMNVTVLIGETCRCSGWDAVRSCPDKPCLRISHQELIAACELKLKSPGMPNLYAPDRLVMSRHLC